METTISLLAQTCIIVSLPAALVFLRFFLKELKGTGNGVLLGLRLQTGVMLFFCLSSLFISILGTATGYSLITRALAYIRTITLIVVQVWVAIIFSRIKT